MSTAIQARFNARWNARYRWARDHGEKYTIAKILAGNIAGFREFVRAQGIDPDTLGDFARKLQPRSKPSGRAKDITRRARYQALRDLGATPDQAREGSGGEFKYAQVVREINGAFKRQEKSNA